jgi:hypothetical protein
MAGEITKRDLATIERLVGKYGAPAVAKAAKAKPAGTPGRPRDLDMNALAIWAHVEFRRIRCGGLPHHSVRKACNILAAELDKWTVGRSVSGTTLGGLYRKGRNLRETNANFRQHTDRQLKLLLSLTGRPLPMLMHREADGSLVTTVFDRLGQSGGQK